MSNISSYTFFNKSKFEKLLKRAFDYYFNDQSTENINVTSSKGCDCDWKKVLNWLKSKEGLNWAWKWIYFVYQSLMKKSGAV